MPQIAIIIVITVVLSAFFPPTIVRLIWSIALLGFGLLCAIGNNSMTFWGYYNKWVRKKEVHIGSLIPLIGGASLFLSVLIYPYNLPVNRFAGAVAAMFLDINTVFLIFSIPFLFREFRASSRPH